MAQYTGNGNQKITLGEQTSADGLVFRGVASIDTVTATSKITRENKQDTSAFLLLDTTTNLLWHYKTASNGWIQAGGSTFDTTTLNLVSRFALKLNIADTSNIKYVNTYGIQTVNGAKTFTTAPTFSTALLGGSGGTGITTFGAVNRIPYASSTTALTTNANLTFDETVLLLRKNSSGNTFATLPNISVENTNTSGNSYSSIVVKANNSAVIGDILADGLGSIIAGGAVLFRTVTNHPFVLQTNVQNRIIIDASGTVLINNLAGTIGYITIGHASGTATGNYYASFAYNGTHIGDIEQSGTTAVAYVTTSDKRLKTPLRSWSLGDKFDNLPIGEFNWLKDGTVAHGTLAQDLYKVYPDAVHVGGSDVKSDPWGVDYGKLTVPLIAEVKSLRSRVKTLEQEQATTTQQLNDLTAKFNQYISTHP